MYPRARRPHLPPLMYATLCALPLLLAACRPPPAKPEEKAPLVEVAEAKARTFQGVVPVTGELKPQSEVTLKSRIGGNVVELTVDEGDKVKKGQLIARIEDQNPQAGLKNARASVSVAEAALARSQADLERATREKGRIEMLAQRGAADQRSLDDSRTAVRLAQAALQLAQAQREQAAAGEQSARNAVNETRYFAPFDGVVSRRGVSRYEYLDTMKNRDIVTIVDNSAMDLYASVAADLAGGVIPGARVDFKVNGVEAVQHGEIIAVNPSVDPKTRTIRLRARIPNPEGRLKGGMYATGTVTVGGERKGVAVPERAARFEAGGEESGGKDEGQYVLWRVRGGMAERVPVRLGARDGDLVEVLTGVSAGDQIVVSDPGPLRPGAAVRTKTVGKAE